MLLSQSCSATYGGCSEPPASSAERKLKLLRISTAPVSLEIFCREFMSEISDIYEVVAVSSHGRALDSLQDHGIAVRAVDMHRRISPAADMVSLARLIKLFRRERPDIVHSMTPKAGLLAMVAAWIANVPIRIHSFSGLLFPSATGWKRMLLKITDSLTCACATNIHSEGEGVRRDLIYGRITHKAIEVLGKGNIRGVDLKYYRSTPRLVEEGKNKCSELGIGKSKVILYVGRVVKDKGIAELVEAFVRFSKIHEDWALLLVGCEEPDEDPIPLVTRCVIAMHPKIYATGSWVEDVRPYYAVARMLVLPSYREGFPNAVIEAGAMSLPSIVTDVNGSREIIEDGLNGLIVPHHDVSSLYRALCKVASDSTLRANMGENALRIVVDRYECHYVRNCMSEYYRRILIDKGLISHDHTVAAVSAN